MSMLQIFDMIFSIFGLLLHCKIKNCEVLPTVNSNPKDKIFELLYLPAPSLSDCGGSFSFTFQFIVMTNTPMLLQ